MRNVNVVAKKMARNGLKIANSLGCAFHFESEFTYLHESFDVVKFVAYIENSGHCAVFLKYLIKSLLI